MKNQNDLEYFSDMVSTGKMTAEQANIQLVRSERFRIIHKLPEETRIQLNNAVKRGELAHKGKEGHKPEVYYHPDFEYLANSERNEIEAQALKALTKMFATGGIK